MRKIIGTLILVWISAIYSAAQCDKKVQLWIIVRVESAGDSLAYNAGPPASYGLYQITPGCLRAFNTASGTNVQISDLYDRRVNIRIAVWYLYSEIPRLLRHWGKPVTVENTVICYNAGIAYVAHDWPIPKITQRYLAKYHALCASNR